MAPSLAYIPSRALLRALSNSVPQKCAFARPVSAQFVRAIRTRPSRVENDELKPNIPGVPGLRFPTTAEEADKLTGPLSEEMINDPDMPVVSWYEQDLDSTAPERLIQRIATPEDRRKHNELSIMLEEDATNPDYDDAKLNRRLLDDLMTDPNFADLTDELQALKAGVLTREESIALQEKLRQEEEPELKDLEASLKMSTYESIQGLINDPELGDAREELLNLQDVMPESEGAESAEFQAALQKVEAKLAGNEAFKSKLAALQAQAEIQPEQMNEARRKLMEFDENAPIQTPEDLDKLLLHMKDLMRAMGGDATLEAEIDAAIKEDPFADAEGDLDKEMDFSELSQELARMAKASAPTEDSSVVQKSEAEVDPELEAKVDKIMQDPKLMEKLMYIQRIVTEEQYKAADITSIAHETAPDPLTLDDSRTSSIQQQLQLAQSDPEHLAALQRLHVDLQSPFNVAPALKSFNQAIELAYLGANDDVRRILWRAYSKARTLPTFLRNLSDDAWDLLYYSQAVTWGSNQNRQSHLKLLLQDLQSVGRSGPPTHPSTLV